jgi:hypothetical protein
MLMVQYMYIHLNRGFSDFSCISADLENLADASEIRMGSGNII